MTRRSARKHPLITIGVCAKNGEDYIREAIESIIDQDFPHELMEVIFVDDGSQDRTLSIIENYVPKMKTQVKVFHQQWKGLGFARQVVTNNAKGKYIIWVDCDMILSRDFVKRQLDFMEKNPVVAIGKGRYGFLQTNLVGSLENMEFMTENMKRMDKTDLTPLGTGGSIYLVEAIRGIGGFDEHIQGSGEDADVESRVKAAGWSLRTTSAVFYERRRKTWKSLWNEYFWHGKGGSHILERNQQLVESYKLFLPVLFSIELLRVASAYKLTYQKKALLLPLHYSFKRIAWFLGFLASLLENNNKRYTK